MSLFEKYDEEDAFLTDEELKEKYSPLGVKSKDTNILHHIVQGVIDISVGLFQLGAGAVYLIGFLLGGLLFLAIGIAVIKMIWNFV